ncbi:MAG TPA: hypothetical protein VFL61_00450 [Gaiellaceae bacterium]|nr:hypothetical protein [Gaiellaceae bacterium]
MLETVDIGSQSLRSYQESAGVEAIEELRRLARPLAQARILHLSATPYGGGVAELLRSEVPLLRDLGVAADWKIITGDEAFFRATKRIHNGLQGASGELSQEEQDTYLTHARRNAELLEETYDLVVVHDPQPLGILRFRRKGDGRWIWRCHIDTSQPNPGFWEFLRPQLEGYDAAVYTMPDFVPLDLPKMKVASIAPGIDPESPKNIGLEDRTARRVLEWIGVELDRPLVVQVSRFDPWKDPLGVIAAYRLARSEVPGLQLALVGSMALDDPEGWEVYSEIRAAAAQCLSALG